MELQIDTSNHRFDKQDMESRQQFFVAGFLFSFHPLLLRKALRQELLLKILADSGHFCGLLPLWMCLGELSLELLVKAFLHPGHLKGQTPLWM